MIGVSPIARAQVVVGGDIRALYRDMAKAKGLTARTMKEIGAQHAEPKIDLDIDRLNRKYDVVKARLEEIGAAREEATVDLDKSRFDAEARALEAQKALLARNIEIVVDMDTDQIGAARRQIARLNETAGDSRFRNFLRSLSSVRFNAGPASVSLRQLGVVLATLGPALTDVAGAAVAVAGSLGEALAGGAVVASGALVGLAADAGGVILALKPLFTQLKTVSAAQALYNQDVQEFGKNSSTAKDALKKLNQAVAQLPPGVQKLQQAWTNLKSEFTRRTAGVRADFVSDARDAIATANKLLPIFTTRTTQAFDAFSAGFHDWMEGLRTPEAQHILSRIMDNTTKAIPPLTDALGNIVTTLGRLADVGSDFFPNLARDFRDWTQAMADGTADRESLKDSVSTLVSQFESWIGLLHATGRLLVDVLGGGASAGQDLVDTLTDTLDRWSAFLETRAGQRNMQQFFSDAVDTTGKLAGTLVRMVDIFYNLSRGFQPLADGFLAGAQFFGSISAFVTQWKPLYEIIKATGVALFGAFVLGKIRDAVTLVKSLAFWQARGAASAEAEAVAMGTVATESEAAAAAQTEAAGAGAAGAGRAAAPIAGGAAGVTSAEGAVTGLTAAFAGAVAGAAALGAGVGILDKHLEDLNVETHGLDVGKLQGAERLAAAATRDWRKSVSALQPALERQRKASQNVADTADRVHHAERHLNRVIKESGPNSRAAKRAEDALTRARKDHRQATRDDIRAEKDLERAREGVTDKTQQAYDANKVLAPQLRQQVNEDKQVIQYDKAQGFGKLKLSQDTQTLKNDQHELSQTHAQLRKQSDQLHVSFFEADKAAQKYNKNGIAPLTTRLFKIQNPFKVATNFTYDFGTAQDKTTRDISRDNNQQTRSVTGARQKWADAMGGMSQNALDFSNTAGNGLGALRDNLNKGLGQFGVKSINWVIKTAKLSGTPGYHQRGGMVEAQRGMSVPGSGSGDKVHMQAMVEPGERVYVLNRNASSTLARLESLNSAIPRFQKGGGLDFALGPYTVPPIKYDPEHAGANSHVHVSAFSIPWLIDVGHKIQQLGNSVGEFAPTSAGNPYHFGPITTTAHAHYPTDHYSGHAIDVNSLKGPENQAWEARIASVLKGGAGAAAQKIAREILQGPPGTARTVGQHALDRTWHAANAYLAKHAGTIGANVEVGPGAISRGEMRKLLAAHGMPEWTGWIALAESGLNPHATSGSDARGLFQILESAWGGGDRLYDPNYNVAKARQVLTQQGLSAWAPSEHGGFLPEGWGPHQGQRFRQGGLLGAPQRLRLPPKPHGRPKKDFSTDPGSWYDWYGTATSFYDTGGDTAEGKFNFPLAKQDWRKALGFVVKKEDQVRRILRHDHQRIRHLTARQHHMPKHLRKSEPPKHFKFRDRKKGESHKDYADAKKAARKTWHDNRRTWEQSAKAYRSRFADRKTELRSERLDLYQELRVDLPTQFNEIRDKILGQSEDLALQQTAFNAERYNALLSYAGNFVPMGFGVSGPGTRFGGVGFAGDPFAPLPPGAPGFNVGTGPAATAPGGGRPRPVPGRTTDYTGTASHRIGGLRYHAPPGHRTTPHLVAQHAQHAAGGRGTFARAHPVYARRHDRDQGLRAAEHHHKHITVHNHYKEMPRDPHTWSRGVNWELQAL